MVHKINSPFGGYYLYSDTPADPFPRVVDSKNGSKSDSSGRLNPMVDVYEDESTYFVTFVIPGTKEKDIHIELSNRKLTVSAKVTQTQRTGGHWVLHERGFGTYIRSIELPSPVKANAIDKSYVNGILDLKIPKKSDKKSRFLAA